MALEFPDAVAALYQSSQELFVSERKRLAAELKAAGDKAGAARLGKLGRPTLSAWAVNQLWWRARASFEELLSSSARLRRGDRSASGAHRDALAALRTRAAALLSEGGHAATDATLRRVTTTLAALAAAGGFEPEPPGALSADRDPPGFEALEATAGFGANAETLARTEPASAPAAAAPAAATAAGETEPAAAAANDVTARTEQAAEREHAAREHAAREQARREQQARTEAERQAAARREREERARRQAEQEEKQQRAAERQELRVALSGARAQLARDVAAVERLRAELALAEQGAERARNALAELEQRQARLDQSEASAATSD